MAKKSTKTVEKVEVVEEVVVEKATKKQSKKIEEKRTKKQIMSDLRKRKSDVEVEILNIAGMRCKYKSKTNVYFDLQPNEEGVVTLEELAEICSTTSVKFFKNNYIIITDVYTDGVSVQDVISFLSLDSVYEGIEDPSKDYIEDLIENSTDTEFEKVINSRDLAFVRAVVSKCIYMNASELYDFEMTVRKDRVLSRRLGKSSIFELQTSEYDE